ncbi:MAG: tRNA (N6-isopentenyl adenosine(37)-C2)-methylthiotransferase MiaB [Candidatus Omnitrophota bacterium]|nr:tRNA (N6-isopentenyl adenosine(37)-C2)-methylthiotransferase MiaB [Candidatus Omnitrophota bacterium]
MNFLDSELVAGILSGDGCELVDSPGQADVVLINGCSVRDHAEQRVWGQLGRLAELKKGKRLKIAVIGCIAENYKEEIFNRFPYVDLVVGPRRISEIKKLLEKVIRDERRILSCGKEKRLLKDESIAKRKSKLQAFVRVMTGCDNFCSYCIVPYVRGRERSRPAKDILAEITKLMQTGYKEIMLLGQNVNSYGRGLPGDIDFADLLKKISNIKGIEKIGFMTSHPKDMSMKLIETIADEEKISRQVHLPVQSGSGKILRLMNRKYTNIDYLRLIDKIKRIIPKVTLSTDVMVGFPTETKDDFKMTCDLMKKVKFSRAFIFKYSPRPPAVSSRMKDDVDLNEKKQRHQVLLKLQQQISLKEKK